MKRNQKKEKKPKRKKSKKSSSNSTETSSSSKPKRNRKPNSRKAKKKSLKSIEMIDSFVITGKTSSEEDIYKKRYSNVPIEQLADALRYIVRYDMLKNGCTCILSLYIHDKTGHTKEAIVPFLEKIKVAVLSSIGGKDLLPNTWLMFPKEGSLDKFIKWESGEEESDSEESGEDDFKSSSKAGRPENGRWEGSAILVTNGEKKNPEKLEGPGYLVKEIEYLEKYRGATYEPKCNKGVFDVCQAIKLSLAPGVLRKTSFDKRSISTDDLWRQMDDLKELYKEDYKKKKKHNFIKSYSWVVEVIDAKKKPHLFELEKGKSKYILPTDGALLLDASKIREQHQFFVSYKEEYPAVKLGFINPIALQFDIHLSVKPGHFKRQTPSQKNINIGKLWQYLTAFRNFYTKDSFEKIKCGFAKSFSAVVHVIDAKGKPHSFRFNNETKIYLAPKSKLSLNLREITDPESFIQAHKEKYGDVKINFYYECQEKIKKDTFWAMFLNFPLENKLEQLNGIKNIDVFFKFKDAKRQEHVFKYQKETGKWSSVNKKTIRFPLPTDSSSQSTPFYSLQKQFFKGELKIEQLSVREHNDNRTRDKMVKVLECAGEKSVLSLAGIFAQYQKSQLSASKQISNSKIPQDVLSAKLKKKKKVSSHDGGNVPFGTDPLSSHSKSTENKKKRKKRIGDGASPFLKADGFVDPVLQELLNETVVKKKKKKKRKKKERAVKKTLVRSDKLRKLVTAGAWQPLLSALVDRTIEKIDYAGEYSILQEFLRSDKKPEEFGQIKKIIAAILEAGDTLHFISPMATGGRSGFLAPSKNPTSYTTLHACVDGGCSSAVLCYLCSIDGRCNKGKMQAQIATKSEKGNVFHHLATKVIDIAKSKVREKEPVFQKLGALGWRLRMIAGADKLIHEGIAEADRIKPGDLIKRNGYVKAKGKKEWVKLLPPSKDTQEQKPKKKSFSAGLFHDLNFSNGGGEGETNSFDSDEENPQGGNSKKDENIVI